MIHHRCPECAQLLTNSPAAAGMTITCPHCHSPVNVPGQGTVAPREAARVGRPDSSARSAALLDRLNRVMSADASGKPPKPLSVGQRIVLGLFGPLFTALFGGLFVFAILTFAECQASQKWSAVQGKVESAGVDVTVGRSGQGRRMVEHSASVVYHYTVQGKEYIGSQIAFGPRENYASAARALARPYSPDQQVTVYYDPNNPSNAVLQREVVFGAYLHLAFGLALGFFGLRVLLVSVTPGTNWTNNRWFPWAHRLTWPDLLLTVVGVIGLVLWAPMLFGM